MVSCDWILPFSIMFSRVVHFLCLNYILLCTIFCLCIHQLMDIWVVSFGGCDEWRCYEHWCKSLCEHVFSCLGHKSKISGSRGNSMFNFWELPSSFPQWLHHVAFPPAVCIGSNFSTSSLTLAIVCLFDSRHASQYEVVSSCGFDLHFP